MAPGDPGEDVPNGTVPLRQYIEAIIHRQDRAIEVAEQEREKAANALRVELARAIEEGDRALRDHIEAQVQQIRSALESAELLEIERIGAVSARLEAQSRLANERLEGLQRESELLRETSERAIAKAEAATEKRFESVNEWRDQSADRERSYQEQAAALTAEFPRREVVDAQLNELRAMVLDLRDKLGKVVE